MPKAERDFFYFVSKNDRPLTATLTRADSRRGGAGGEGGVGIAHGGSGRRHARRRGARHARGAGGTSRGRVGGTRRNPIARGACRAGSQGAGSNGGRVAW